MLLRTRQRALAARPLARGPPCAAPGLCFLPPAAEPAFRQLAAPAAHAERLQPPLNGSGGGGGGGGGGGAPGAPQAEAKRGGRKRVMILMSDTGGGHRASAEALKAAFHIEFGARAARATPRRSRLHSPVLTPPLSLLCRAAGDAFDVSVVDLWSHHSPYPTNKLPKSCAP